jgi:thioesterase domain-containing protein
VVQPDGPYHLGGWSLGGVVAFEMARQLQELGQEVASLILIDSRAPAAVGRPATIDDAGLETAFLLDVARGPVGQGRDETMARLSAEFGPDRLRRLQDVFKANALALSGYLPRPYPGRLALVRAGGHALEGLLEPTLGWGALAAGGVSTHVVPGDHYTLLQPPSVETLARILEAEMVPK